MAGLYSLEGKGLIVTGAASGIGRGMALHAAEDGARLVLMDRSQRGLEETLSLLPHATAVSLVCCDLSVWDEVESAVGQAVDSLGVLDGLCNIAGGDEPGAFWEQTLEYWHELFENNMWSTLHTCRATVGTFKAQQSGRIVNLSSDAGRVGSKGEAVYSATKGGVIALTKSLARELAPYGVGVNCVAPGPTRTPAWDLAAIETPKLMEKLERAIPFRRISEPSDQARAIAFFLSDASAYITGQVLSVSGGLTMV